jgi:hypothetical protein
MRTIRPNAILSSLTLATLLFFAPARVFAADPPGWFPLIVRGGMGVTATYESGTLTVRFRKARVAAGDPTEYGRMPPGSAAWVDRPLNDTEPFVLKQRVNQQVAGSVIEVLRNEVRFWKFVCQNTNDGYFDVLRSEATFQRVSIDRP